MQEHLHTDGETPGYWPKHMPYQIPPDYFLKQRKAILRLLRHELTINPPEKAIAEIDRLSPLLSNLKKKGVRGRWDQNLPVQNADPAINAQAVEIKIENTPIKKMNKSWIWAAAAVLTGLLLMGRFMTSESDSDINNAENGISYNLMTDSVEISDEEIRSFLSETVEFPIEKVQHRNSATVPEPFLANADLLAAPDVFSNNMDAIPMHELEAYINDIPSLNN